jgi:hypothetical protein
MSRERTITASDLPPRHYTSEDRKALGYEVKDGAWHKNGRPICSRPAPDGYMRIVNGALVRSPAPPVCGQWATVRMVKSGRFYCSFHAPKHGEREAREVPS